MTVFLFPEALYGPTAEVRSTVGKLATKVLRDDSLDAVMRAPRIDVGSHPGSLVLARRWVAPAADQPNFHADLLWRELVRRVLKKAWGPDAFSRLRRLAASALTEPWWFAGLLGSESYFLVERASQQLAFIDHARAHWDILLSVSGRYSPMTRVENTATLVSYCLARQGAKLGLVSQTPLTLDRFDELLGDLPGRRVQSHAIKGEFSEAVRLIEGNAARQRESGRSEIATLSLAEHLVDYGQDALACGTVRALNLPDPHGHVARWLAGEGDPTRTVR